MELRCRPLPIRCPLVSLYLSALCQRQPLVIKSSPQQRRFHCARQMGCLARIATWLHPPVIVHVPTQSITISALFFYLLLPAFPSFLRLSTFDFLPPRSSNRKSRRIRSETFQRKICSRERDIAIRKREREKERDTRFMANDKNWRVVGLSYRNLRNIREEDLQENEFRVRSESGQMKPDSACNTCVHVCVCVCFPFWSGGIFGQTRARASDHAREERKYCSTKLHFVCAVNAWRSCHLFMYTYVHARSCRSAGDSRIGNPVETNSGKSSPGSGRLVLLPTPPLEQEFLRTLWHRDTLKTCEEYLKHATLAVTTCSPG